MANKNWSWSMDIPDNELSSIITESRVLNLIRGNEKTFFVIKQYCISRGVTGISVDLLYYLLFYRDRTTNICYFNLPSKIDFCNKAGLVRLKDRSPKITSLGYHIGLLTKKNIIHRNSMNSYSVNLPKGLLSSINDTDMGKEYSLKFDCKEKTKITIQCHQKKV